MRNWALFILIMLTSLCSFSQDKYINASFGHSWQTGKKDVLFLSNSNDSSSTSYRKNVSMGGGTALSINFHTESDSSLFFYELGIGAHFGYNIQTFGLTVNNHLKEYTNAYNNRVFASTLIGINLKNRNNAYYIKMGMVSPIYNHSYEKKYYYSQLGYYKSYFIQRYKPSIGFTAECGFKYKVWEKTHILFGLNWTVLNQRLKHKRYAGSIANYTIDFDKIYANKSEKETRYLSKVSQNINDPIINPKGFDKNKPLETVVRSIPFGSSGIILGINFKL